MTSEPKVLAFLEEAGYAHLFPLVHDVRGGRIEIDPDRGTFHAVALARNVLTRCPGVRSVDVRSSHPAVAPR